MDCIVHGVAKSGTRLSAFHFHFLSFTGGPVVKNPPAEQKVRTLLVREDPPSHTHQACALEPALRDQRSRRSEKPGTATRAAPARHS